MFPRWSFRYQRNLDEYKLEQTLKKKSFKKGGSPRGGLDISWIPKRYKIDEPYLKRKRK